MRWENIEEEEDERKTCRHEKFSSSHQLSKQENVCLSSAKELLPGLAIRVKVLKMASMLT